MKKLLLCILAFSALEANAQLPSVGRSVYYNFNGNLNDDSGNGFTASISGNERYVQTPNSTAGDSSIVLNGLDSDIHFDYTGNDSFFESQNFTCVAQLKLDTIFTYNNIFEIGNKATTTVYFRLRRIAADLVRVQGGHYDATTITGNNYTADINTIDPFATHTYTFKSSYNAVTQVRSYQLFVDQQLISTLDFSENAYINFSNVESKLSIGNRYNDTTMTAKGEMDYFMFYNVALDETLLSTDELEANQMLIYPNPTTGIVTIETPQVGSTFQLVDASGRVLRNEKLTTVQTTLDLSSHKNGIYFISVNDGLGNTSTKKLIVRK